MNTMAAPSTTTAPQTDERTAAQVRQLEDIARHAVAKTIEKLNPGKLGTQQAIDRGNEITQVIEEKLAELLEVETFADEEEGFDSQYDYPQGFQTKPLADQIRTLYDHFGTGIFPNQELLTGIQNGTIQLPEGAEGWYAIPNPAKLASTYGESLQRVIDAIAKNRALHNYRAGQLGTDRLRRTTRTTEFLARLAEAQGNPDILIVAAQFGKRHAGRSVRRARFVFTTNEFGLGGYEVACMLLTHPERLVHYDNLWIDCPGDEYDYGADGSWRLAPVWDFRGGQLEFDSHWFGNADSSCGSASGFLPQ